MGFTGEPFQLFLGRALAQKVKNTDVLLCAYDRDFPRHATVTAQADGVYIWDLRNLHAVASYSAGDHVAFTAPAFTLYVKEDGNKSAISYAIIQSCPTPFVRGRSIWVIRHDLSCSGVPAVKTTIVFGRPLIRICGTGHAATPLLLVSKDALYLADKQVRIKSQVDWPGKLKHLETFVFPRDTCSFIQNGLEPCQRVAITCLQSGKSLHVRVLLMGDEFTPIGTCEIPIAGSVYDADTVIGLTCSPCGILSFIDLRGMWVTYQLTSIGSSLSFTPVFTNLLLQRFSFLKNQTLSGDSFSAVSLGSSLVLVASIQGTQDISLQIWDLAYGVLLATQSMPVPSTSSLARIRLTVADEGQVLLTLSPEHDTEVTRRSSIHVVSVTPYLKSSLAAALGKAALTAKWSMSNSRKFDEDRNSSVLISNVQDALQDKNAQQAEQVFLEWVDSHSSREAALGHESVKKIFNVILPPESPADYPYTPRITRCLLENAVVSTLMLDGRLITALRKRGDWENVMLALTRVTDISEDELVASAKFLVDRQRKNEDNMAVDVSEGYVPHLWTYLFACVSYPFSPAPMRLAIRKHLPDARDLILVLEIIETWIQGGTEYEMETLLKSVATDTNTISSGAETPPYAKIIMFLQVLLDASFVALLQYQPSYDLLCRILSYIEPEIVLMDNLELLRGLLEPFVKEKSRKERMGREKETPSERKERRKQLAQQDDLNIGLYRLEELVI